MFVKLGMMAEVNHPITVLNATKFFEIIDIKVEISESEKNFVQKVWIRGEDTCWFNVNMIKTLKDELSRVVWEVEFQDTQETTT